MKLQESINHDYSKANNTPLRQEPLSQLLGEQMDFDKWEEILKGTINEEKKVQDCGLITSDCKIMKILI